MAERKLVMGYWDCSYCGTRAIPGTQRNCPNCQNPRGSDTKFYMNKAEKQYLTDEEAKAKGRGADWQCEYCGALNSALTNECSGCGAIRDEANQDYFQVREEEEKKAAEKQEQIENLTGGMYHTGNAYSSENTYLGSGFPGKNRRKNTGRKNNNKKILIAAALFLVLVVSVIYSLIPKTKALHVDEKQWQTSVEIEKYQEVSESDWNLPSGASLLRTAEEIHHYDQVLAGYETETYQELEAVGSHTEYTYKDNGDGTFTEIPTQVTDYDYVTKTREVPVYQSVPVFKTKYYYTIWRWLYDRSEDLTGTDNSPVYAEPLLGNDERTGTQTVSYTITGTIKNKTETYTVSEEIYMQISKGDDIKAIISSGNQISELK